APGPPPTGRIIPARSPRRVGRSRRWDGSSGSTPATLGPSFGEPSAATGPDATSATRAAGTARRGSTRNGRRSGAETAARPAPTTSGDEDRSRLALRLSAAGRRDPARPLPLREPPAARPRRPDPDL